MAYKSVNGEQVELTAEEIAARAAEEATFVPSQRLLALREFKQRMVAEGVLGTWLTYMDGTVARRRALFERIIGDEPLDRTEAGLRNTMTAAGIADDVINRVLA